MRRRARDGGADIVCGFHAVRALLDSPRRLREVLLVDSRADKRMQSLRRELQDAGVSVTSTARAQLDELAGGVKHQGVVARVHACAPLDLHGVENLLQQLSHPPLLLILDQVQDPHNLGACMRSAAAAGVDALLLPQDRACRVTPAAARVASGAGAHLPLCYAPNLARAMDMLRRRGVWLIGADGEARESLHAVDFSAPTAIILGAEGRGLRRLTREKCDALARIPMHAESGVPSLNVSAAAAVFLFEARRQRAHSNSGANSA